MRAPPALPAIALILAYASFLPACSTGAGDEATQTTFASYTVVPTTTTLGDGDGDGDLETSGSDNNGDGDPGDGDNGDGDGNPGDGDGGDVLWQGGDRDDAIAEWRAVLTSEPDDTTRAVAPFHRRMAELRLAAAIR
jgi:hypothetical protein